ncbi:unnamed protein product [Amoebophrya sp. A25]|nr:unnamed protein product [Amoebophrya sp. A25]|eukprot:GSA25T00002730001.1
MSYQNGYQGKGYPQQQAQQQAQYGQPQYYMAAPQGMAYGQQFQPMQQQQQQQIAAMQIAQAQQLQVHQGYVDRLVAFLSSANKGGAIADLQAPGTGQQIISGWCTICDNAALYEATLTQNPFFSQWMAANPEVAQKFGQIRGF